MQDLTWAEAIGSGSELRACLELPAALTSRLAAPNLGTHLLQRVDDTRHGRDRKELSPVTTNKRPGWKLKVLASAAK